MPALIRSGNKSVAEAPAVWATLVVGDYDAVGRMVIPAADAAFAGNDNARTSRYERGAE